MSSAAATLEQLERLRADYGSGIAARKLACLQVLARAKLGSARAVLRLHESLCFLQAYPDDAQVLRCVRDMLERFSRRPDLRRHRLELCDSGIAGTDIRFPFFAPMARWLARRYGPSLSIDWPEFEQGEQLRRRLELLVLWGETAALASGSLTTRQWIERLKGEDETDATFLVRRFEALRADPALRDALFEELALPMRIAAGPDTPSRTLARYDPLPVHYKTSPLRSERPSLAQAAKLRPRSIRAVDERRGEALIELAREAMVTRSRDLDPFAFGDARDVRLVDCGDGLQFACIGVPARMRFMLEAVYGFLTLQNGVPVGYVLASALFGSAEVAYNVFESYRGGEAAYVYGRVLGMLRALFGARSFSVPPYQLGHGNDEGLRSGAWWFYQKLGFRACDATVLRSMRSELAAIRRDRRHRSDRKTLRALVKQPVFWPAPGERRDVVGLFPFEKIGQAISADLSQRFGADRERGQRTTCDEAAQLVGARGWRRWPPDERLAFERWSPLVAILPGIERWNSAQRGALRQIVRAKGGQRESDYVPLFDRHRPLRRALLRLAREVN